MPVGRELHDVIKVNSLSGCSDYSLKGAGVTVEGVGAANERRRQRREARKEAEREQKADLRSHLLASLSPHPNAALARNQSIAGDCRLSSSSSSFLRAAEMDASTAGNKEREAMHLLAEAEKRVKSSQSFLRGFFG